MNTQLQNITINLLGLENDLWSQTHEKEQDFYVRSVLYYLSFILLAIFAEIYLLYIITSSIFVAIPAGLFLAAVIGNVLRFSLVILRRSIFDPEKIKKNQKNDVKPIINENAISQSPAITSLDFPEITDVIKVSPLKKGKTFIMGIKHFFSDRFKISIPTEDTPIPILSGIIRFVILSVLGLMVLFPLACLFHFPMIEKLNEQKRQEYLHQFVKNEALNFQVQTSHLTKSIAEVEKNILENKSIYQKEGMLKEKGDELKRLNKELDNITVNNLHQSGVRLDSFQSEMARRYFIVLSFKTVMKYPLFLIVLFIVSWLIIIPHLLLYRLKTNNEFTYSLLSTKYYKDKINTEYTAFQDFKIDYLKRNYNYSPQGSTENVYWENPPYCTIKKQKFPKRKLLNKKEFLKSLEKISN